MNRSRMLILGRETMKSWAVLSLSARAGSSTTLVKSGLMSAMAASPSRPVNPLPLRGGL